MILINIILVHKYFKYQKVNTVIEKKGYSLRYIIMIVHQLLISYMHLFKFQNRAITYRVTCNC